MRSSDSAEFEREEEDEERDPNTALLEAALIANTNRITKLEQMNVTITFENQQQKDRISYLENLLRIEESRTHDLTGELETKENLIGSYKLELERAYAAQLNSYDKQQAIIANLKQQLLDKEQLYQACHEALVITNTALQKLDNEQSNHSLNP